MPRRFRREQSRQQLQDVPTEILYTEVGGPPAAIQATRALMGLAAAKGMSITMGDAESAYLQVPLNKNDPTQTYVRLPKGWWPASWFDDKGDSRYRDPVVLLRKAVYGHVESGARWEQYLAKQLLALGWIPLEPMPGFWAHRRLHAFLAVYVDDLVLMGDVARTEEAWAGLASTVEFGSVNEPLTRYLGLNHHLEDPKDGTVTMKTEMDNYLRAAVEDFVVDYGHKIEGPVDSPYFEEIDGEQQGPGALAPVAAKHLMRLLFAARMGRPTSCTRLCG